MSLHLTIDRVEGAFAIVECGGAMHEIALSDLSVPVREGQQYQVEGICHLNDLSSAAAQWRLLPPPASDDPWDALPKAPPGDLEL